MTQAIFFKNSIHPHLSCYEIKSFEVKVPEDIATFGELNAYQNDKKDYIYDPAYKNLNIT